MVRALYPGSFDPVTYGHLDIACRAARIFSELVIGVYDTPRKHVLFSTKERIAIIRSALEKLDAPNITVAPFQGLTVDFAKEMGAKVLVRGLRAMSDFEMEFQWALMNRKLNEELEVVCLVTSLKYLYLSSSNVKELARLGGRIDDLVPPEVAQALRERLRGQGAPVPRHLET
ncbi:MAG: pantetheine-phosphate adenylyltransferase [Chloroflexi bacterium]|nr:pantetheine-phosphate adenylyltransferase [Chloroflexota bacterium]